MKRRPRRQDSAAVAVAMLLASVPAPLSAQEPGDAELLGELGVLALAGPLDAECDGFDGGALARAYEEVGARRFPRVPRRASLQGLRRHARLRLLPAVRASERALREIDVRLHDALGRRCRGDWMQMLHARVAAFLAVDAHLLVLDEAMVARVQLVPMGMRYSMLHHSDLPIPELRLPARRSWRSALLLAAQERHIGPEVAVLLARRADVEAPLESLPIAFFERLERMTVAEHDRPACAQLDGFHADVLVEHTPALHAYPANIDLAAFSAWADRFYVPWLEAAVARSKRLEDVSLGALIAGCPLVALDRLVRLADAVSDIVSELRSLPTPDFLDPEEADFYCESEPHLGLRLWAESRYAYAVELAERHGLYVPAMLAAYEGLDRHRRSQGLVELVGSLQPANTPAPPVRLSTQPAPRP
ncbi:MAG: hypothetical protein AAF447_26265 [Myxococcota bacterium]